MYRARRFGYMGKGEHFSDMETLQLIVDHCNKVEAVVDFLGKDP